MPQIVVNGILKFYSSYNLLEACLEASYAKRDNIPWSVLQKHKFRNIFLRDYTENAFQEQPQTLHNTIKYQSITDIL